MSNSNKVKTATEEEHNAAIALMRTFMYSDKPKVGIFWYDFVNNSLFGVSKINRSFYLRRVKLSHAQRRMRYTGKISIGWQSQRIILSQSITTMTTMQRFQKEELFWKMGLSM